MRTSTPRARASISAVISASSDTYGCSTQISRSARAAWPRAARAAPADRTCACRAASGPRIPGRSAAPAATPPVRRAPADRRGRRRAPHTPTRGRSRAAAARRSARSQPDHHVVPLVAVLVADVHAAQIREAPVDQDQRLGVVGSSATGSASLAPRPSSRRAGSGRSRRSGLERRALRGVLPGAQRAERVDQDPHANLARTALEQVRHAHRVVVVVEDEQSYDTDSCASCTACTKLVKNASPSINGTIVPA